LISRFRRLPPSVQQSFVAAPAAVCIIAAGAVSQGLAYVVMAVIVIGVAVYSVVHYRKLQQLRRHHTGQADVIRSVRPLRDRNFLVFSTLLMGYLLITAAAKLAEAVQERSWLAIPVAAMFGLIFLILVMSVLALRRSFTRQER
jgi:heme/copper-type cytochrome/quinol oxidase subunit 2